MGVPAFFRWLTVRYPKVVIDALSEDDLEMLQSEFETSGQPKKRTKKQVDSNEIDLGDDEEDAAADLRQATALLEKRKEAEALSKKVKENNPAIDNLYLDMNGIIHPCAHPQNGPQPESEQEIFENIFVYTDKVINLAKPQKLIYFAIDGVAPRAKMNQQRSRRFRTAKEAEETAEREANIKAQWSDKISFKDKTDSTKKSDFHFDSNVITPGTEFMYRLSKALKKYIVERANTHASWKGLSFIFSDAFVPGEGEHKILDFIRGQRAQANYNPQVRHCIYGADADLIMLGLSTHETHFYILREAVMRPQDLICHKCKKRGHVVSECGANYTEDKMRLARAVEFQFVKIAVVREYLLLEFQNLALPYPFDFERIVDDFVFLCFLVGNDFLPHLPSLQIREGALDVIMAVYKHLLPSMDGYLTNQGGEVNFSNVDVLFRDIAKFEEEFFKVQLVKVARQRERNNMLATRGRGGYRGRGGRGGRDEGRDAGKDSQNVAEPVKELTPDEVIQKAEESLKNELNKKGLTEQQKSEIAEKAVKEELKRQSHAKNDAKVAKYVDTVKMGVDGYKVRYYTEKFLVRTPEEVKEFGLKIRQAYIEGLAWVFQYYYKGCVSWDWYYPFHYAPFASDLINCDRVKLDFKMGEPSRPFEQLMSVLPKQSSHALPTCYRHLQSEPSSSIIDFYPIDFKLDINGAAYAWMGVNLLPFIDRPRLLKAMKEADQGYEKLTPSERVRNQVTGDIALFFQQSDKSESALARVSLETVPDHKFLATFASRDQVHGECTLAQEGLKIGSKIEKTEGDERIVVVPSNQITQVAFLHPHYDIHSSKLLENAVLPRREVEDFEILHVDRKFFQGENSIRLVERVLGIDTGLNQVYKYGYKNNHATYEDQRQSNQSSLGKRSYRDSNQEQGNDRNSNKRPHHDNNGRGSQGSSQQYGQQHGGNQRQSSYGQQNNYRQNYGGQQQQQQQYGGGYSQQQQIHNPQAHHGQYAQGQPQQQQYYGNQQQQYYGSQQPGQGRGYSYGQATHQQNLDQPVYNIHQYKHSQSQPAPGQGQPPAQQQQQQSNWSLSSLCGDKTKDGSQQQQQNKNDDGNQFKNRFDSFGGRK